MKTRDPVVIPRIFQDLPEVTPPTASNQIDPDRDSFFAGALAAPCILAEWEGLQEGQKWRHCKNVQGLITSFCPTKVMIHTAWDAH